MGAREGVILLVSQAHKTALARRASAPEALRRHLGRLLHPLDPYKAPESLAAGLPLAADNRAFVDFEPDRFRRMVEVLAGLPLLFVAVPDVVGDAAATDELWAQWAPVVKAHGLPAAYVAQDDFAALPEDADALFVGGTTDFKIGPAGEGAVAEAKRRGLWVHVGRVNTEGRMRYIKTLGADSMDGTKWSRWSKTYLVGGLAACSAPPQARLFPTLP